MRVLYTAKTSVFYMKVSQLLRVFLKSTGITLIAFLWLVLCARLLGPGGIVAGLATIFMISVLVLAKCFVRRIEKVEGGLPKSMQDNKD